MSEKELFQKYGAQLGEIAWHSIVVDERIDEITIQHYEKILKDLTEWKRSSGEQPIRFIEVCSYAHYSGQLLAEREGLEVTLNDISANALRLGDKRAKQAGVRASACLVAADYHDLPFSSNYFDIVYIASALHHTWSPTKALNECLRILKPGGLFILENEPCKREFCFYTYRSNRAESFSPLEQHLHKNGLLRIISAPFFGSRPEDLFGMIENDRIPLSDYTTTMDECLDLISCDLDVDVCMDTIDRRILERRSWEETKLAESIAEELESEIENAGPLLTARERALGFGFPDGEEISAMSKKVARLVRKLPTDATSAAYRLELANLFGAAIRAVGQKRPSDDSVSRRLFRRSLVEKDGVFHDTLHSGPVALNPDQVLMPHIQEGVEKELYRWFYKSDWELYTGADGVVSLLNRSREGRVSLPKRRSDAVLVLRLYTVEIAEEIFTVQLRFGDQLIDKRTIAKSETHLFRALIGSDIEEISLSVEGVNEIPSLSGHLRLNVVQLMPFTTKP